MNKFVSFEMVFDNGERFMGNMIVNFGSIETEEDIKDVEYSILTRLNSGQDSSDRVGIVTLTNWKTL